MRADAQPSPQDLGPVAWLFTGRVGPGLVALAAALAFAAVLATGKLFNDGDTYWHLATGDWILAHRAVPTTDSFSYTFAGRPWHAHEWLSEILMALAYRAAGWNGLSLLFAGAFALTTLALGRLLARWQAVGPWIAVLAFALACGAPSLLARPHLLAQPFLVVWLAEMLRAREARRAPRLILLPLMLVWANMHGSFVLGLGLTAAFGLEALIEAGHRRAWPVVRGWGLFGGLALALGLMTPQGLSGLTFALKVSAMTSLPLIAEWLSPNFNKVTVFEVALLETLFFCLWRGVKVAPLRLLILLGFFHMSLQHVRHQAVFALVAAMILAEPFARASMAGAPAARAVATRASILPIAVAVMAALLAGAWRLNTPSVRHDSLNAPISALAAVPPDLARRPVFNAYGFGGYLIFKGVKPYIDGRGDMYGDAFLQTYGAATRPSLPILRRELAARHVDWTILTAGEPAVAALDALPEWRRLHSDHYAVVHVRRAAEGLSLPPPPAAGSGPVLQAPQARPAPPG